MIQFVTDRRCAERDYYRVPPPAISRPWSHRVAYDVPSYVKKKPNEQTPDPLRRSPVGHPETRSIFDVR